MPTPIRPKKLLTRRRFLKSAAALVATGGTTYGYATTIAPHRLSIEKLTLPVPNLPLHRHGTRLALLSDLHAGPRADMDYLKRAINTAADLQPHFLLMPGDFIDSDLSQLETLCKILDPISALIPSYGSTGNHDFAHDFTAGAVADIVCNALTSANVRMLRNDFHQPAPAGDGDLCFVGLEDLWSTRLDPATLDRAPQNAFTILLSHNPDSYESVARFRFHLMLSGHTHGGQVCIPGIGPLILPVQHRERAAGLFHFPHSPANEMPHHLYVTRGVGHLLKVRLFCPPEITLITLQPAASTL